MQQPANHEITCHCSNSQLFGLAVQSTEYSEKFSILSAQQHDRNTIFGFTVPEITNFWALILVTLIWIVFGMLATWARIKDKRMKIMKLPIDLADNASTSRYIYLVIIKTGGRLGAGTTSRILFNLTGTKGVSASHWLVCHKFQVLQRTHTNIFLVRTKTTLGDLVAIKFWHHNTGTSPAWFVSRVSIADLQSKRIYYFLCNSWIGNNRFEGEVIIKTFQVASKVATLNIKYLITYNASRSFSANHTLFSIFCCPFTSRYTRFERVGVCMNLLTGYLMCNLLFLNRESDEDDERTVKSVGRLMFSTERLVTAFYCALIMFPVTTGIEAMFECVIRKKHKIGIIMDWKRREELIPENSENLKQVNPLKNIFDVDYLLSSLSNTINEARNITSNRKIAELEHHVVKVQHELSRNRSINNNNSNENESSNFDNLPIRRRDTKHPSGREDMYNFAQDSWRQMFVDYVEIQSNEHSLSDYRSERFDNGFLPWWFKVIAWIIVIGCVLVFSAIVILNTLNYPESKLLMWAGACFMSFFIGMVVEDPFKIIIFSIFYSLVIRKVKEHAFRNAEKVKYMCLKGLESVNPEEDKQSLARLHDSIEYKVPNQTLNMLLVETELMKEKSRVIVVQFSIYLFFTVLALFLTFFLHDYDVLYSCEQYNKILFQKEDFQKIDNKDAFWNWLNTSFLEEFYPEYSDPPLEDEFFKATRTGDILLRSDPCMKRTTGDTNVWAFYMKGVSGKNKGKVCLGMNRMSAIEVIKNLSSTNFLNSEYYFNHIEMLLFSPSLEMAIFVHVKGFVLPGGGVIAYGEVTASRLYELDGRLDNPRVALFIVFLACLTSLAVVTFRNIVYIGVAEFFISFWNLIDLWVAILSIFFLPAAFFFVHDISLFSYDYLGDEELESEEIIMSRFFLSLLKNTAIVLYVLKGISFLRYNNRINQYFIYLGAAVPDVLVAQLAGLTVLIGFALASYGLFGKYIRFTYTIEYSLVFFLVHLPRTAKFRSMAEYSKYGPFVYTMFVLIYLVIVRNLCIAIMVHKFRKNTESSEFAQQLYFKAIWRGYNRFLQKSFWRQRGDDFIHKSGNRLRLLKTRKKTRSKSASQAMLQPKQASTASQQLELE